MAKTYYFTDYPFEETSKKCNDYILSLDWENIRYVVRNEDFICLDVTDCVKVFPHLELDEDYQLMCYISHEHHGYHGRIAAIKKGESTEGAIEDEPLARHLGIVDLPETAVNPMEVIFNDGTAEGFLEAVLFSCFLCDIPNNRFRHHKRKDILQEYPDDINSRWDVHIEIMDLRPKAVFEGNDIKIYLYRREYAKIFLPTDGRDEITLSMYVFNKWNFGYWSNKNKKEEYIYKNYVDLEEKYSDIRHTCLFVDLTLQVAKVKYNCKCNYLSVTEEIIEE